MIIPNIWKVIKAMFQTTNQCMISLQNTLIGDNKNLPWSHQIKTYLNTVMLYAKWYVFPPRSELPLGLKLSSLYVHPS